MLTPHYEVCFQTTCIKTTCLENILWPATTGLFVCMNLVWLIPYMHVYMMTSSNRNIFRVTGPLCREFTGDRWIPRTKASNVELWMLSLICTWQNGWLNNGEAGDLRHHRAHYDVIVMTCICVCVCVCVCVYTALKWSTFHCGYECQMIIAEVCHTAAHHKLDTSAVSTCPIPQLNLFYAEPGHHECTVALNSMNSVTSLTILQYHFRSSYADIQFLVEFFNWTFSIIIWYI